MKKIVIVMMVLCGLALFISPAYADHVKFSFDGLNDWGTSYTYDTATDTWKAGTPTNLKNPFDNSVSQNLANGVITAPDGKEDSFGIARINTIIDTDNSTTLFDRGTSPYELTVMFYGFDDTFINGDPSNVQLLSRGGHALVYQDYAKDYNTANPPNASASRAAGTAPILNGTLVLDLTAHSLTDPVGGAFTLKNGFNFTTFEGDGSVYFDVTDGTWQSIYDTNTLNGGSDIGFAFSSFPVIDNKPGVLDSRKWLVTGTGEGHAFAVPEPMSMFMVVMGVMGFGATQRKRKKIV